MDTLLDEAFGIFDSSTSFVSEYEGLDALANDNIACKDELLPPPHSYWLDKNDDNGEDESSHTDTWDDELSLESPPPMAKKQRLEIEDDPFLHGDSCNCTDCAAALVDPTMFLDDVEPCFDSSTDANPKKRRRCFDTTTSVTQQNAKYYSGRNTTSKQPPRNAKKKLVAGKPLDAATLRKRITAASLRAKRCQFVHDGVRLAKPHILQNIKFYYGQKSILLSANAEEAAILFARCTSAQRRDATFRSNFLLDFCRIICKDCNLRDESDCLIEDLSKCDFLYMKQYCFTETAEEDTDFATFTNGKTYPIIGARLPKPYILKDDSPNRGRIVPRVQYSDITINITHIQNIKLTLEHDWKEVVHEPHNDLIAWWKEPVTGRQMCAKMLVSPTASDIPLALMKDKPASLESIAYDQRILFFDLIQSGSFTVPLQLMRDDYTRKIEAAHRKILQYGHLIKTIFGKKEICQLRLAVAAWFVDQCGLDILATKGPKKILHCLSLRVCDLMHDGNGNTKIALGRTSTDVQKAGMLVYGAPVRQTQNAAIYAVTQYLQAVAINFEPIATYCNCRAPLFGTLDTPSLYHYMCNFFSQSFMEQHPLFADNLDFMLRVHNRNTRLNDLLQCQDDIVFETTTDRRTDFFNRLYFGIPYIDAITAYWEALDSTIWTFTNALHLTRNSPSNPEVTGAYLDFRTFSYKMRAHVMNFRRELAGHAKSRSGTKAEPPFVEKFGKMLVHAWRSKIRVFNSEMSQRGSSVGVVTIDPRTLTRYALEKKVPEYMLLGESIAPLEFQ